MSLKWCNKCKQELPLSDFYIRRLYGTYQGPCKKCRAKVNKLWRKNNYERFRYLWKRSGWRKRGVNPDEAEKVLSTASSCSLCNSTKNLYVDHDHDVETIRGILCNNCNLALGHFKDNSEVMRKAADYVDRHRETVYN
jgi:Fe-S oxidoreductase